MPAELQVPVRWWACPSCDTVGRTQRTDVHTEFHHCPAMNGAAIPLVQVPNAHTKPNARQLAVEREDYVGDAVGVTYIDGKAIAAIRTERADGSNDCTVFPTTAIATGQGLNA